MLKSIRRYNKWFLAGFGVLLMVAWLVGPTMEQLGQYQMSKEIGSVDGRGVSYADHLHASREVQTLTMIVPGVFGIQERDPTHWMLLVREAEAAGYVGEGEAGRDFTELVANAVVDQELRRDINTYLKVLYGGKEGQDLRARLVEGAKRAIPQIYRSNSMSETEGEKMMARAAGVFRMMTAHQQAARVSDRLAAAEARKARDAVIADYVFVPASLGVAQIPDPDEATLKAHFDKYREAKPGEGEYGVGYKFPARVKLEWMKLDRAAFEKAAPIDPVEVRKRWSGDRVKYPGEFAAEREKVEKDMRAAAADVAMQEAQLAVQAEVLKAVKGGETHDKYRVLPADWEQKRPKLEAIAQAVVEQAKPSKLRIPLPEVTIKAGEWLTLNDLVTLPGIGRATVQQGGMTFGLSDLVRWTKEFPRDAAEAVPVAVQTGLTLAEHPLIDPDGNRYYLTVLAVKEESPLDSIDEKREQIVKDYKMIQAFERLKARADEFRQLAIASGLEAVAKAVSPPDAPPAPPPAPDGSTPPPKEKVEVRKQATINREGSGGDPNLDDAELRKALLEAAQKIDPVAPFGSAPPEQATVALATPKHLGVAVFRIQANAPLTREAYRSVDQSIVAQTQQKELTGAESPFSLANMLKRHIYISGETRINTPEDLRREKSEG